MEISVDWATLKSFFTSRNLPYFYATVNAKYIVCSADGSLELKTEIPITTNPDESSDQYDFEENYESGANQKFLDSDGDNTQIVRVKYNTKGWHFQDRYLTFETSKLNSVVNIDPVGDDRGDATIKFYDADDVELTTQQDIDTDCVKTVLDVEPEYDYEVIEGGVFCITKPTDPVYVSVIMVPDVPEGSGGSKVILCGADLSQREEYEIDGRAVKRLNYSATYHTNKMRAIVLHPAGLQLKLTFDIDHFKA